MYVVQDSFPRCESKEYQFRSILVWQNHQRFPLLPLRGAGARPEGPLAVLVGVLCAEPHLSSSRQPRSMGQAVYFKGRKLNNSDGEEPDLNNGVIERPSGRA